MFLFVVFLEGSAMISFEVDVDGLFGVASFKILCGYYVIS